jgi:hypothetical protein
MSTVIIGVDPGDSTGVATLIDTKLFHAYQGPPGDALTLIELTIARHRSSDVTIACERYVNMQTRGRGRTHQPTAQRVSGALEHIAKQQKCRFVLQSPADAWGIASNELLRRVGMYQTNLTVGQTDADDANMAARHALLYLSHKHATLFADLLQRNGVVR